MEDRQLLLAKQEYGGTREMLRRVGIMAKSVDDIRTFAITRIAVPKATISELIIYCIQPDGTWKVFSVFRGEMPSAIAGAGHLAFPIGGIKASSTVSGTLFIRVRDDADVPIGYWEAVGTKIANAEIAFDMPDRDYGLIVEVGHL